MVEEFKFAPVKSLVDAPFFAELSKHKLNDAKLDSKAVDLCGFMNTPLSENRQPAVRLTMESFQAEYSDISSSVRANPAFTIPGKLLNTNTIEEFRDMDKIELLKSRVKHLAAQIKNESALFSPELLTQFFLLTFADLKKYKYYYWLMFPVFKWTSQLRRRRDIPANPELDQAISDLQYPACLIEGKSLQPIEYISPSSDSITLGIVDYGTVDGDVPWHLRNVAALLSHKKIKHASIYLYRRVGGSRWYDLDVGEFTQAEWEGESAEGWERNSRNKLVPKLSDLSSLMNPLDLADQAIDLNLKLMKWRAAPEINLEILNNSKCLLLGAGTLGSYIARGLMAWGVRNITFVDSGTVSYSNPVRQPLYTHEDCIDAKPKAETAAKALKAIFPAVNSKGFKLEVPMAGHPITNDERQRAEYDQLVELLKNHDAVFLLMDSRESRWLPTVITQALQKPVINVALGFDSYLVMRHGVGGNVGCYFCNDVVAPSDSISRQTLDQMCTVTRPGCSMLASGYAAELFANMMQHPLGARAPHDAETVLGSLPHQLRGFMKNVDTMKIWGPAFSNCSACGPSVDLWRQDGWEFVKRSLNDPLYVTEVSGLGDLQRKTEDLDVDFASEDDFA